MKKTPVAVLISGRGSNMIALVQAAQAQDFPARIALVLSNKADAKGLEIAREKFLIPACVVESRPFGDNRQAFECAMDDVLQHHKIEFICLAGFMRLLTPWFVQRWQGKMINIHPALLPKFKGVNTHQRAIDAGETQHGATVHWVENGMDEGETIMQQAVPVFPQDNADMLADRVLQVEHSLYPKALRAVLSIANPE